MVPRVLLLCAVAIAWTAPPAWSQAPTRQPGAPARVYGIELEALGDRERVLIFAERELDYAVEAPAPGRLVLVLRDAVLDPTAPTRVLPTVEGAVRELGAAESLASGVAEVQVEIAHRTEGTAQVSQRGAIVAVEFDLPEAVAGQEFALNFEDAELGEVLGAIARATGQRFILGDTLEGRVSIAVPGGVNRDEALQLLDAALFLRGYAAVPGPGGYRQVIRVDQLAARAPWRTDPLRAGAEGPVATLVRLERADPGTVVSALRESLGETGLAIPLAASRSVLLAGGEGQIRRWIFLAQSLDRVSPDELRLLRIRHRPADEVARLLEDLFAPETGRPEPFEVWSDARTNTLVVRATGARFDAIREWLRDLDRPAEGAGDVGVIPVEHVDPEGLAELLRELVSDAAAPPATVAEGDAARAAGALTGRSVTVAVHKPTASLVVESDPATLELVREVVDALDRRLGQVLVEAIVSEITVGDNLELGFDFAVTLGDPDSAGDDFIRVSSITREGGLVTPGQSDVDFAARLTHKEILVPIVGPGGETVEVLVPLQQAQIVAASSEVGSRIVMRPTFVAASGEEQVFFAGDNIPIPTGTTQEDGEGADPLTLTTQIDREDVGLELRVRPSLGEAGDVALETEILVNRVNPELTAALLGGPIARPPLVGVTRQGIEEIGTALSERRISTTARLRDGQSAVIGFFVEELDTQIERGTPFLRHLPVLGMLFRNNRDQKFKRYFMISLSATILRDAGDLLAATLRTRLAFQRSLARVNDLRRGAGTDYAVLITTRPDPEQVAEVARQLDLKSDERVEITRWEWAGDVRYDVYVTGFASLTKATAAANRFGESGWRPRVVAVPSPEPPDADDDSPSDTDPASNGARTSSRAATRQG